MGSSDRTRRASYDLLVAAVLALAAQPTGAALCNVPTPGHPTIGAAARDVACTTIQLAAGSYPENVLVVRDLAIAGAGAGLSFVSGAVEVSGPATDVTLAGVAIAGTTAGVAGCWPSLLRTTGGARLATDDDVVVTNSGLASGACRLFVDGFESGNTLAWSAAVP